MNQLVESNPNSYVVLQKHPDSCVRSYLLILISSGLTTVLSFFLMGRLCKARHQGCMLAATGKNDNNGIFLPTPYMCYLRRIFKYCDHGLSLHNDWIIWHIEMSATMVAILKNNVIVLFVRTATATIVAVVINTEKYVSPINDLTTFLPFSTCRFFRTCYGSRQCWEWWE